MRPVVPRSRALTWVRVALLAAATSFSADAAAIDAAAPAKTSFSSDQSDLWWVPSESGWGMQIVQQAGILFATLFVYDATGVPTFYTATLVPSDALAWTGRSLSDHGSVFRRADVQSRGGRLPARRRHVAHDRQSMSIHWTGTDGTTCDFGGAYAQQGHVGQFAANYLCSNAERGNMSFFEMTNRIGMVAGRFRGHSDNTGCDRSGGLTGLAPE